MNNRTENYYRYRSETHNEIKGEHKLLSEKCEMKASETIREHTEKRMN
jgi:hypothetical protein